MACLDFGLNACWKWVVSVLSRAFRCCGPHVRHRFVSVHLELYNSCKDKWIYELRVGSILYNV